MPKNSQKYITYHLVAIVVRGLLINTGKLPDSIKCRTVCHILVILERVSTLIPPRYYGRAACTIGWLPTSQCHCHQSWMFQKYILPCKNLDILCEFFSLYLCMFIRVVWVVTFFVMLFLFYLQTKVLFTEAYRQNSRLDHLTQIMGFHPQYLACFLRTQNRLMRAEGPLPYEYRHYIAIIVSKSKRYIVLCSGTAVIPTLFHSLIPWCKLSLS